MDHGVLPSDHANMLACNATVWPVSLGFGVTFSALFTKNYRINKIFNSSTKMRRVNVSIRDVAIPMMILLIGECVLNSIRSDL